MMYADFGNDEWVSTDCLRVLNEKFCQNPPFAVLMSLCEGTEDQEVLTRLETLLETLLENPVNVLFVKKNCEWLRHRVLTTVSSVRAVYICTYTHC